MLLKGLEALAGSKLVAGGDHGAGPSVSGISLTSGRACGTQPHLAGTSWEVIPLLITEIEANDVIFAAV